MTFTFLLFLFVFHFKKRQHHSLSLGISPLEVAPLSRLTEGIKNGVQFFRTKWDQPNIGETCQTYFKRIQEEIDKQVNELKGLKKYCKSIESRKDD